MGRWVGEWSREIWVPAAGTSHWVDPHHLDDVMMMLTLHIIMIILVIFMMIVALAYAVLLHKSARGRARRLR
eukprot:2356782-Pleurochrysis_carterae.AAC.1